MVTSQIHVHSQLKKAHEKETSGGGGGGVNSETVPHTLKIKSD